MCRCCQSCLESCYWHCCEKWFCYDESIALWEDPEAENRNQNGWDNMAYWDSIAVIANRSIVTIQPTSDNKIPQLVLPNDGITDQLNLQDDLHRRLSEVFQNSSMIKDTPIPPTHEVNHKPKVVFTLEDETVRDDEVKYYEKLDTIEEISTPTDGIVDKDYIRSGSVEDLPTTTVIGGLFEAKSHERIYPMLTKRPTELRLIKQSSMPNFYVDQPDLSELTRATNEKILTSPILPNTPTFKYDLRSIVEMEKSKQATEAETGDSKSKRLMHIRKKIAPLIIKKPSLRNLTLKPTNENHPS